MRGALERQRKAVEQLRKDAVDADAEIERAQKRVEKAAEEHAGLIAEAAASGRSRRRAGFRRRAWR